MNAMQPLGWALVHYLWQGTLVAAVLAVALRSARGVSPAIRYALAVAALVTMAMLPVVTALRASGGRAERTVRTTAVAATATPSTEVRSPGAGEPRNAAVEPQRSAAAPSGGALEHPVARARERVVPFVQRSLPVFVAVWIGGVLALSLRLLGGWMQAQRLRRIAVRPLPEPYCSIATRLALKLRIGRSVAMLESTWVSVPAVVGWLRPALLVPAAALTGLAPRQIEMLLAHELAHVRRHDYLVNLLQSCVETLLFYHPATWWVSQRIRIEREHCCDDLAVAVCGDARLYARTLADLEQLRAAPALAVAASGGALRERVRRLVAPPRTHEDPSPRWIIGAVGIATACAALVLVLVSPRGVQVSQAAGAEPEREAKRVAPAATHPDAAAGLADRWAWGIEQARARGARRFWLAYAIRPNRFLEGPVFAGHIGDDEEPLHGHGMSISGRFVHIGDPGDDSWNFPGQVLDVPAEPGAVALVFQCEGARGRPTLLHAHAASLVYPVNLHDEPLFWLGAAAAPASLDLVRTLGDRVRGLDARVDLVSVIGVHDDASAVPLLIEKFRSSEPEDVRTEAAEWLARHPGAESLSVLTGAARADRSAQVRREAAESVGEMQSESATDSAIALARTLADPDARREAVESLGDKSDEQSLAALVRIARDDHDVPPDVAREAAESLGSRSEPRAREALRDIAREHRSSDVRREAVETLGESLPPAEAADWLQEIAVSNSSEDAQVEAIETLAKLAGGRGIEAVRRLARTHPRDDVRRQAVEALGRSAAGEFAVEDLAKIAAEDASSDVQREAVETLGERPERRAREIVAGIARDDRKNPDVRREAVETLGHALAPEEAARVLAEILRAEHDPDVVREALETLMEIPDGRGIPEVIRTARSHADPEVRREALRTLVDSDDPRARAFLERAVGER